MQVMKMRGTKINLKSTQPITLEKLRASLETTLKFWNDGDLCMFNFTVQFEGDTGKGK